MPPRLRDERLAWLAVADRLDRESRRSLFGFLMVIFSRPTGSRVTMGGGNSTERKSHAKGRMLRYSIAVDKLSRRLTPQEREVLRASGEVPAWFYDAVIAESRNVTLG